MRVCVCVCVCARARDACNHGLGHNHALVRLIWPSFTHLLTHSLTHARVVGDPEHREGVVWGAVVTAQSQLLRHTVVGDDRAHDGPAHTDVDISGALNLR